MELLQGIPRPLIGEQICVVVVVVVVVVAAAAAAMVERFFHDT